MAAESVKRSGAGADDVVRAGGELVPEGEPMSDPNAPTPANLDDEAPTLASLYGLDQLAADRMRELVQIGSLPHWPRTGHGEAHTPTGHGWGEHVSEMLGGGIAPGETIAVGASSAGAGKTAFMMQLADGLALQCMHNARRNAGTLTPVLVLSEMGAPALTWRSLSRWTGASARIYRAGRTATGGDSRADVEAAWVAASRAFAPDPSDAFGDFGRARAFMRVLQTSAATGPQTIERAAQLLALWRAELERAQGLPVVPVVVMDPIQRFQGSGPEIDALNATVEALGRAAERDGFIAIVTSDTNKSSATGREEGNDRERATAAFRGSYKLQHLPVATLYLERLGHDAGDSFAWLRLVAPKNRWGATVEPWPCFKWHLPTGRMLPVPKGEAVAVSEREAAWQKEREKERRGKSKSGGDDPPVAPARGPRKDVA